MNRTRLQDYTEPEIAAMHDDETLDWLALLAFGYKPIDRDIGGKRTVLFDNTPEQVAVWHSYMEAPIFNDVKARMSRSCGAAMAGLVWLASQKDCFNCKLSGEPGYDWEVFMELETSEGKTIETRAANATHAVAIAVAIYGHRQLKGAAQ